MVVLVRGECEVASWPLGPRARADLATVDSLARLQLAARRLGYRVRLRHVPADLGRLLDLVGLVGLLVEVGGQAEGGEEAGVEEVVVADDPVD